MPLALRPGIHAITECAIAAFRRRDRPHGVSRSLQDLRENLEPRAAERLAHVLHHDRIAQIGLVATVFAQGVGIGNERKFRRHRFAVGEFLKHAMDDRFDRIENVLLGHKAHLKVELIKLARRAIGARILVAKARRDLEVTVETRDHDQLLELLRRLRQRVKFPRMQPRGHEVVARTFG